ncbi:GPO family capsid scaffolding protein [Erwinia rhapontici]|uniref:GPO family capsid scaffolding protein n=1 Tax=Erwinia rhapontici TaxID=55212 RepID=UPI00106081E3|nr:GPO family capsid scaffolding protein [Erwinia rhapontici]NKG32816.1 GPO family capsid scaffolding protein [Erwinia rhapontici]TDS93422.1 capsid scaffolding serine peptidase GPO [Erwinia rhapontici]
MAKTKKVRIAVEGATTDGRNVERLHIEQAAKNYSPEKYGARVNLEHFKSLLPDSAFRCYGDVTAVSAEEIADGPLKGKLALYAEIDPTPELIALNQSRQKVYTSAEFHPSFSDTGEAYLMGIALTDSPASLGTEILKFSAGEWVRPLLSRKTDPACFFAEGHEAQMEFEADVPAAETGNKFFSTIKALLSKGQRQFSAEASEIRDAVELVAKSQADTLDKVQALSQGQVALSDIPKEVEDLRKELVELKEMLASQDNSYNQRPSSKGGNGDSSLLADC